MLFKFIYLGYIEHQHAFVSGSMPQLMSVADCFQVERVRAACIMLMSESLARTQQVCYLCLIINETLKMMNFNGLAWIIFLVTTMGGERVCSLKCVWFFSRGRERERQFFFGVWFGNAYLTENVL